MTSATTAEARHRAGAAAEVLVVTDLVRRFGQLTAVDRVSFHIDPGEERHATAALGQRATGA